MTVHTPTITRGALALASLAGAALLAGCASPGTWSAKWPDRGSPAAVAGSAAAPLIQVPPPSGGTGVDLGQVVQLAVEVFEEGVDVAGVAHDDADLVLHVHRLGEGAQVEADDGLFDPLAGGGDDFFVVHGWAF